MKSLQIKASCYLFLNTTLKKVFVGTVVLLTSLIKIFLTYWVMKSLTGNVSTKSFLKKINFGTWFIHSYRLLSLIIGKARKSEISGLIIFSLIKMAKFKSLVSTPGQESRITTLKLFMKNKSLICPHKKSKITNLEKCKKV